MTTKMKGLIKGIRYISQIFDEKEQEIQIGYPTDVKHIAHIGWDGPSANSPSWMNDFKSAPELPGQLNLGDVKKLSCEDINSTGTAIQDSLPPSPHEKPKHKSRRKPITSTASPLNSPTRKSSDAPKPSRRHHSSHTSIESQTGDSPRGPRRHQNSNLGKESPLNSPTRKSSDAPKPSRRHHSSHTSIESQTGDSPRRPRRHQNLKLGMESPSHDQPSISKHSRRRRSKGSSGDGSTKSSRSKGHNSTETFPDLESSEFEHQSKNNESHINAVL